MNDQKCVRICFIAITSTKPHFRESTLLDILSISIMNRALQHTSVMIDSK